MERDASELSPSLDEQFQSKLDVGLVDLLTFFWGFRRLLDPGEFVYGLEEMFFAEVLHFTIPAFAFDSVQYPSSCINIKE